MSKSFTLTVTCAQRPGIVHAVSSFLLQHNCDIAEHQQFDDTENGTFFLRTSFVPVDDMDVQTLTREFQTTATEFGMSFEFSSDELQTLRDAVAREHDFRVTGHRLIISGICHDCSSKRHRRQSPLDLI